MPQSEDESAKRRGAIGASKARLAAAGGTVSRTMKKATGGEFRANWQEFSDSVATILIGLHTDLTALQGRLEDLEKRERKSSTRLPMILAFVALVIAAVALALAVAAL